MSVHWGNDDWKHHDTQDHEAHAAYYDQLAQEQAAAPDQPSHDKPAPTDSQHLRAARDWMAAYESRINQENFRGDAHDRQLYEDRAYKQAMMHATYASAEAATRQAEVAESLLDYVADLMGGTNLLDAIMQWSYRQKAG